MVSADRPGGEFCARTKNSALALVLWHDGDVASLALAGPAGAMAPRRAVRLLQSNHCRVGALGHCVLGWGPFASGERHSFHMESCLFPPQAIRCRTVIPFCGCGSLSKARAGGAQRLRFVECAGAISDGRSLWMANCAVLCAPGAAGGSPSRRPGWVTWHCSLKPPIAGGGFGPLLSSFSLSSLRRCSHLLFCRSYKASLLALRPLLRSAGLSACRPGLPPRDSRAANPKRSPSLWLPGLRRLSTGSIIPT